MGKTNFKAKNKRAAEEGRAVYVRGIPPDWSERDLDEMFRLYGDIESINLMPARSGQTGLAGFVNFESAEEAFNAAAACDNSSVIATRDTGKSYNLACSIKREAGTRVGLVSGFSDLSQARQEKRSLYISGLVAGCTEEDIRHLCGEHGCDVEKVNLLPVTRNLSCFIILGSTDQAVHLIEQLDGKVLNGRMLSVTFPTQPKKTKDEKADTILEIRGFPEDSTPAELQALFEHSGREIITVKILRHVSIKDTGPGEIIALVFLSSLDDAYDIIEVTDGMEFLPGSYLHANIKPQDDDASGSWMALDHEQPAFDAFANVKHEGDMMLEAPMTPPDDEGDELAPPPPRAGNRKPQRPPKIPPAKFAECTVRAPFKPREFEEKARPFKPREFEERAPPFRPRDFEERAPVFKPRMFEDPEGGRQGRQPARPSSRPASAPPRKYSSSDWQNAAWDEHEEPARKRNRPRY